MNALVRDAIERRGLLPLLDPTTRANSASAQPWRAKTEEVDLLVLGALADEIVRAEVGLDVCVRDDALRDVVPKVGSVPDFLRSVAIARIFGSKGANVGIALSQTGVELAQLAVLFGANELVGELRTKQGLPIADDQMGWLGKRSLRGLLVEQKRRELSTMLAHTGRRVRFVEATDGNS